MQKIVINKHRNDEVFMKNLIKSPLWLSGLILSLGISAIFVMSAQVFIGPALVPGLMAGGLIVLAIGSVKIVGESLKISEIIGILILILGIALLGISELSIDLIEFNLVDTVFIVRTVIFTASLWILALLFIHIQKNSERFRSILFAIASGYMFALSSVWIGLLMGVIGGVFGGSAVWGELILFIVASIILVVSNMWGVKWIQDALKYGQASNLIPIQQVPIQITPMIAYYLVFLLIPPSIFSIFFSIIGVALIIWSSFLLGQRQAELEKIRKEEI